MRVDAKAAALTAFLGLVPLGAIETAHAAFGDCGQPVSGGAAPVATDALFTLGAAVGTQVCDPCVCDVDSSAGGNAVSATDALIILRRAVDPLVALACSACEVECDLSAAPECGGVCANGGTCAPEPTAPDDCSCLGSCELGSAPTCGGACDGPDDDPSDVCTSVLVSHDGGEPEPACLCLPDGIVACEDSEGLDCQGVCHAGSTCEESGKPASASRRTPKARAALRPRPVAEASAGPTRSAKTTAALARAFRGFRTSRRRAQTCPCRLAAALAATVARAP